METFTAAVSRFWWAFL